MPATQFPYLSERERGFEICRRAAMLDPQRIASRDGRRLAAYTAGTAGAPTVLLVNPLGTSCLFFIKLIEALAPSHRVVTWEMRGIPDYYPDAGADDWSPETHARDLGDVLAALGGGPIDSVISYCSGSYLALHAIARGVLAPSRIALISPPIVVGANGRRTLYQKTLPSLLARIARSGPQAAAIVRALMQQGVQARQADADYELHVLNNLPFTRDETTYRYACLHAAWQATPWADVVANIALPAAIFHGTADEIVHEDTVTALSSVLPGARLRVYDRHGHFAVYTSDELIRDVVSFATER